MSGGNTTQFIQYNLVCYLMIKLSIISFFLLYTIDPGHITMHSMRGHLILNHLSTGLFEATVRPSFLAPTIPM